jgi:hypothetical protein
MSHQLDKKKVEQAFKRAATMAVSNEPDARAGRYRVATVYFVRDGRAHDDQKDWLTNEGRELPLEQIVDAFPHTKAIWSHEPPVFNPESSVNPDSGYRHVVVHVRGAESTGQFTKDGFWTLDAVSPAEFMKRFPNSAAAA